MKRIIEFSHPGKQINLSKRGKKNGSAYNFIYDTSGIRFWNNENEHFRKFINNKGVYLKKLKSAPQKASIQFWGEWEPQSDFILTGKKSVLEPNAIHKPFISASNAGDKNTDPFVFGNSFYYSNCKQSRNNMYSLDNGSLIIFGSEYDEGFALDTVFIIDSHVTAQSYLTKRKNYPLVLREATLDLRNLYQKNPNLKLYKALMYDINNSKQMKGKIFSFFPCKSAKEGLFKRPLLKYEKFGLQTPGARTVVRDIKYTSVSDYWNDLVTEVLKQGCSLGIQTDIPLVKKRDKFFIINGKRKGTKKAGCIEKPIKGCIPKSIC